MNFSKSVLILLGKYSKMDVASSNEPEAGQLRAAMATCGLTAEKTHTLCGDTAVYVPKWHGVSCTELEPTMVGQFHEIHGTGAVIS